MNLTENQPEEQTLQLVKYRILGKRYSAWRAIIAETGESDTMFLLALKALHGIEINKIEDPVLYVSQDTHQMGILAAEGVPSPTLLQILLTAKAFALTEGAAKDKMKALLREMQTPPQLS